MILFRFDRLIVLFTFFLLCSWNEWIVFPLKLSELPRDAILGFTIWDTYAPRKTVPVGATAISIFGKYGCLRAGVYDLRVWPSVEAKGDNLGVINGKSSDKTEQISKFLKASIQPYRGIASLNATISSTSKMIF